MSVRATTMRRPKQSSNTTSLDLLLDTICNMFGGVLLMAVLVVVLTQSQASHVRDQLAPEEVEQTIANRQLRLEVIQLETEVASLKRELRETESDYAAEVPAETRHLLDRKTSFKQALKEASARLERAADRQRQLSQDLSGLSQKESELSAQIASRKRELSGVQAQMRQEKRRVKHNVRLPHQKGKAAGRPVYYLIKGDRIYRQGITWRWRGEEFVTGDCIGKPVPNSNPPQVLLRPRPGAGAKVTKASVQASLRNRPPRSYYVVMWVYNDSESFGSFQKMKKYVLDSGYRYVAGPKATPGKSIRLVPARHHKSE